MSNRLMRNIRVFLAVLVQFVWAFPALSHPGSGIVVDSEGRVYFAEAGDIDAHLPGAIWQIDAQGKLTRLHEGGAHYLTLDRKRGFPQSDLSRWFGERVSPWLQRVDAPEGALIQADGQPIAIHRDGSLYFAKRNMELIRMTVDGKQTAVVPALEATTEKLGGIKGLGFGPENSLYVACPGAVLKVGTNGTVSTVTQSITVPDCDREFPPNTPEGQSPYLRGLAVDARGMIYAAATGCRAVVRITPSGETSVILRAESPWSPTGVAVHSDDVYVLEYEHPNSARREEWVPRVRKVGRDGKVTTVVTLPTAQGRPVNSKGKE
jgi:sugar lactone lactonase YvrE